MASLLNCGQLGQRLLPPLRAVGGALQQTRFTKLVKRRRSPFISAKWESPYIVGDYIKDVNPPAPVPEEVNLYDHTDVVDTDLEPKQPLRLILLDYIEDLGVAGDVLDVDCDRARWELLLPGKAVYASPFNLQYYRSLVEKTEKREGPSSATAIVTMKLIRDRFHKIVLSGKHRWQIEKWHIRAALRSSGIVVPDEAIELPERPIVGPEGTDGKAFIVHILINGRERAPARFVVCLADRAIDPYWHTGRKEALLAEQDSELQSLPIVDPPKRDEEQYD